MNESLPDDTASGGPESSSDREEFEEEYVEEYD